MLSNRHIKAVYKYYVGLFVACMLDFPKAFDTVDDMRFSPTVDCLNITKCKRECRGGSRTLKKCEGVRRVLILNVDFF